jgi:two-component system, sensor histidine kinase and response regulator
MVLIVDDELDLREILRDAFQDEGFAVEVACDGAEAMRRLARLPRPVAVILDIVMPVMDGNEVLTAMQRDPELAAVPVIVTTSDPSRAPRNVPVVRKPLDLDALIDRVKALQGA